MKLRTQALWILVVALGVFASAWMWWPGFPEAVAVAARDLGAWLRERGP